MTSLAFWKAATGEKEIDKEAQARRIEKRESRIGDGLAQLETWLADIVADGLAATRAQGDAFWEKMAARLVDAQAPGLARRVRELSWAAASREWQTELLAGIARLQLLIDGYRALDRLAAPLAAEVRSLTGWPFSSSAVSFVKLFLAECNSSTLFAMVMPLALCHGPLPIRSRALMYFGSLSAGACVLR